MTSCLKEKYMVLIKYSHTYIHVRNGVLAKLGLLCDLFPNLTVIDSDRYHNFPDSYAMHLI